VRFTSFQVIQQCAYCDPYGLGRTLPEGYMLPVCQWHATKALQVAPFRGLPPGWLPSWRRGLQA
jgi:hypothetical protein